MNGDTDIDIRLVKEALSANVDALRGFKRDPGGVRAFRLGGVLEDPLLRAAPGWTVQRGRHLTDVPSRSHPRTRLSKPARSPPNDLGSNVLRRPPPKLARFGSIADGEEPRRPTVVGRPTPADAESVGEATAGGKRILARPQCEYIDLAVSLQQLTREREFDAGREFSPTTEHRCTNPSDVLLETEAGKKFYCSSHVHTRALAVAERVS